MSDLHNEGRPAPESEEGKALAELEKEMGIEATVDQPPKPTEVPAKVEPTPAKQDTEPNKPAEKPAEQPQKVERAPIMVEAYKLRIAEDQKDSAIKQAAELQAKLDEISKQKTEVTPEQKEDVAAEIKALAEESGIDEAVLQKIANIAYKSAKPSSEIEKYINESKKRDEEAQKQQALKEQIADYTNDFDKNVAPILKEKYQISDEALSKTRDTIKDYAFSEKFAKLTALEIFQLKEAELDLKAPKRSSEGSGIKVRQNEVIDLENVTEETFDKLPDEKVESFVAAKTGGNGWNRPGSRK